MGKKALFVVPLFVSLLCCPIAAQLGQGAPVQDSQPGSFKTMLFRVLGLTRTPPGAPPPQLYFPCGAGTTTTASPLPCPVPLIQPRPFNNSRPYPPLPQPLPLQPGQQATSPPQPYLPGQPGTSPQQPYLPGQPGTSPQQPGQPGTSPQQPGQPGTSPQQPYLPGTSPQQPYLPGTSPQQPYLPGQPGTSPQQPGQPGTSPQQPYLPGTSPQQPGQPGTSPQQPYLPGTSPQQPYLPGTSLQQPYLPGQPGTSPQQPYLPGQTVTPSPQPYLPGQPFTPPPQLLPQTGQPVTASPQPYLPGQPVTAPPQPFPVPVQPVTVPDRPLPLPVKPETLPPSPMPVPVQPVTIPDRPMPLPVNPVTIPDRPMPLPVNPVTVPDRPMPLPVQPVNVPDRPMPLPVNPVTVPDRLMPNPVQPVTVPPRPMPFHLQPGTALPRPLPLRPVTVPSTAPPPPTMATTPTRPIESRIPCSGLRPFVPSGFSYANFGSYAETQCNCVNPLINQREPPCTVLDSLTHLGATRMRQLIEDSDVNLLFRGLRDYTIFAPLDVAFERLPIWLLTALETDEKLRLGFVLSHFVKRDVALRDMDNEVLLLNSRPGNHRLRINKYFQQTVSPIYTVDGARILRGDILVSNGRIHLLDKVIMPNPPRNAAEYISERQDFEEFWNLLKNTDVSIFQSDRPVTVFIPLNAAVDRMDVAALSQDSEKLQRFIGYHVVNGTYFSSGLINSQYLMTNYLKEIKTGVVSDGFAKSLVTLNGHIRVVKNDIPLTNGVAHIIEDCISDKMEFYSFLEVDGFEFEYGVLSKRHMKIHGEEKFLDF